MTPVALIVCAYGYCFNPAQITFMEPQGNITGNCRMNFADSTSTLTLDASCEELSKEINKQLFEKTGK